jgi:acid phosphatase type 7
MIRNIIKIITLTTLVIIASSMEAFTKRAARVQATYLTWDSEDTATTMVVKILTLEKPKNPRLLFGTAVQMVKHNNRFTAPPDERNIPNTPLFITSFSLSGLSPDSTYFFNFKDDTHQATSEESFRTLPANDSPVEFLSGGDMSASPNISKIAQAAVTDDTMAYVIGGDIAYDDGKTSNYKLWLKWFSYMNTAARTPNGRMIPMILALGNHEANSSSSKDPFSKIPFYTHLFLQNGGGTYFKREFASHTTLFALDSGHFSSHSGAQKQWLEKELSNSSKENKMAVYHVPLYPTHRSEDGSFTQDGRDHWLPLFDAHNLTLSFENHDHTLKRTHMLRNNKQVQSGGTVYVGDGCWGVGARTVNKRWYHHLAESKLHIWRVKASSSSVKLEAIGTDGIIYDEFAIENKQVVATLSLNKKKVAGL